MINENEIEVIAHNVAKSFLDTALKSSGELAPNVMTNMYIKAYVQSKRTILEYNRQKKLEAEKNNPFSESYSYTEEHPKLTPHQDANDDLFDFYKGKSI